MSVSIIINTIPMPEYAEAVGAAIVAGIGERSENERWKIYIREWENSTDYIVIVEGPDGFQWEQRFTGADEQTSEFIEAAVREATHSP